MPRPRAQAGRARDVAITDFCCAMRAEGVLNGRSGRRYLLYACTCIPVVPQRAAVVDDAVPEPARRLGTWALYALCAVSTATAVWFGFLGPSTALRPPTVSATASFARTGPPPPFETMALNAMRQLSMMSTNDAP